MELGTLWTERLRTADEARQPWMTKASVAINRYAGLHVAPDGRRYISTNKTRSALKTRIAGLLRRRIESRFKPLEGTDEAKATAAQHLANWTLYLNDIVQVSHAVAYYAIVPGVGITYTTWGGMVTPLEAGLGPEAEAVEGRPTARSKAPDTAPERVAALQYVHPGDFIGQPVAKIHVLHPRDFLLDPQAHGPFALRDARWTAHRYWLTPKECRKLASGPNPFFNVKADDLHYEPVLPSTKALENLATEKDRPPKQDEHTEAEMEGEDRLWEVWQIHDAQEKQVLWVMPGTEKVLRDTEHTLGMPYQDFRPDQTPDTFWCNGDAHQIEELQNALDQVMDDLVTFTGTLANPKNLWPEGTAQETIDAIAESPPGSHHVLPAQSILQKGTIGTDGTFPEGLKVLPAILGQAITETTAISEVASGVLTRPETTATEANISTAYQNNRTALDRDWFTFWLKQVVARVDRLNQKFFTQTEALPILGLSVQHWRSEERMDGKITHEDIKGKFDYEITVGDAADATKAEDKKVVMDLLSLMVPFMGSGLFDPIEAWTMIFNKLGLDPSRLFRKGATAANVPQMGGATPAVGRGPTEGNAPTAPKGPEMAPDQRQRSRVPTEAGQLSVAARGTNGAA